MASDIQSVIERIHSRASSESELLELLADGRALVRANVLMELVTRELVAVQRVVDAVRAAAHAMGHANVRLMGSTTQRDLAIATLAWLPSEYATQAYESELAELASPEREHVKELVAAGPVS